MAYGMFKGGAYVLQAHITALGTAQSLAIPVPFGGRVTRVIAVSDAAQTTGISTVTVVNASQEDDAIASLAFAADYVADTLIEDTSLTNATVAAGEILTVATNGTGDGAGEANVVIWIEV
jgi:hypothetical protein